MKQARYMLEAVLMGTLMALFRLMPLDVASATGGAIGRAIGPRLAASRKALRNIGETLPQTSEDERKKIIAGMWENLGRVVAEYPHLREIGRDRATFVCSDTVKEILAGKKPCMMISCHISNWEIGSASLSEQYDIPLDLTYRAPNNPYVDKMLQNARSLDGKVRGYAKSRSGGQDIIRAMREGRSIAILIDQKYNEGVAVPFFGRPAMTNPVFVQLARKFGYPVIPAQLERTDGANFTITLHDPLIFEGRETEAIIAQAHTHLEEWIRKRPEQWLWLHRRWDSQKLETMKEAA